MRQTGCLKPQCLLNVSFSSSKMLFLVPQHQSFTSLQSRKAMLHRVLVYYITPRTLITIFEYDKGIHSSSWYFTFLFLIFLFFFTLEYILWIQLEFIGTFTRKNHSQPDILLPTGSWVKPLRLCYKDYFCSSVMIFEINKEIILAATESTLSLLFVQGSLKQRTHR